MNKFIHFLRICLYKCRHLYMLLIVCIAELLFFMGDLSLFLTIPELAPTLFIIVATVYFWKKWGRKRTSSAMSHLHNQFLSFIFWSYTFIWITPFPNVRN